MSVRRAEDLVDEPPSTAPVAQRRLPSVLLSVGATAGAVIGLQLSLTRLFSLIIWYHFAFLAISLAMLGLAVGATLKRPESLSTHERSALGALVASLSTAVILLAVPQMRFELSVLANARQFSLFLLLIVMVIIPFAAAGYALTEALRAEQPRAGLVYGADLIGSGLAGILAVVAMDRLGGGAGGAAVSAMLFALSSLGFFHASRGGTEAPIRVTRALRYGAPFALVLATVLAGLSRNPLHPLVYAHNAKIYPRIEREAIRQRRCTSLACVDFFDNPGHFGLWGVSNNYRGGFPEQIGIVIDGWALTSIPRTYRDIRGRLVVRHRVYDALPPSFAHMLRRAALRPPGSVLVVGAGGGMDVRAALHHNAQTVDAVELNPSILREVQTTYSEFSGPIFVDSRVRVIEGEGRSVLEHSATQYDLVQLSGVDTYAASQAGAFALTENYLYTREAIETYMRRLTPNGTLTLTRWLYHPDRQTIRLVATIDEAFRRQNSGDLASRMIIAAAPAAGSEIDYSVIIVQRQPFTRDEYLSARILADIMHYRIAWAADGGPTESPFREYFAATNRRQWVEQYPWRITATTDDSPFFFEHTRWSQLFKSRDQILGSASGQMVLVATALLLLAIGSALLWTQRKLQLSLGIKGYFSALGIAYMFVESALIPQMTLCLGHPVYALTVVLSSLLIGSGVGSAVSDRLRINALRASVAASLVVALVALGAGPFVSSVTRIALAGRVTAVAAAVFALGFVLGMPFPLALREVRKESITGPWVYNAVASSVGGTLAMILAIQFGFRIVLVAAAALYVVAAFLARKMRIDNG